MAVNSFDSHLSEVGAALQELNAAISRLDEILGRHDHNGYGLLVTANFDGRAVTKDEYDAAMSSIDNLIETWLPAGHGTNIDGYLYETL